MTAEEFATWRASPVTRWIFRGVERAAEQERAEWDRVSWGNGVANPQVLNQLRDRANALRELIDNDYQIWSEWNGEQPGSDDD